MGERATIITVWCLAPNCRLYSIWLSFLVYHHQCGKESERERERERKYESLNSLSVSLSFTLLPFFFFLFGGLAGFSCSSGGCDGSNSKEKNRHNTLKLSFSLSLSLSHTHTHIDTLLSMWRCDSIDHGSCIVSSMNIIIIKCMWRKTWRIVFRIAPTKVSMHVVSLEYLAPSHHWAT